MSIQNGRRSGTTVGKVRKRTNGTRLSDRGGDECRVRGGRQIANGVNVASKSAIMSQRVELRA